MHESISFAEWLLTNYDNHYGEWDLRKVKSHEQSYLEAYVYPTTGTSEELYHFWLTQNEI